MPLSVLMLVCTLAMSTLRRVATCVVMVLLAEARALSTAVSMAVCSDATLESTYAYVSVLLAAVDCSWVRDDERKVMLLIAAVSMLLSCDTCELQ